MPPIEGWRKLISRTMSRKGKDLYKLMFIDISKAYLQELYVDLPNEVKLASMCGRLRKALYGTREAARCWEKEYTELLMGVGFKRGKCNPCTAKDPVGAAQNFLRQCCIHCKKTCMFYHADRSVQVLVRGGDFTVSGPESQWQWIAEVFKQKYLTEARGVRGPDAHDQKAITILNRIVEWKDDAMYLEADLEHVLMIIKELGLEKANESDVTGRKGDDATLSEKILGGNDITSYRSIAARLNFLAVDRTDIQFAATEICMCMSGPMEADWDKVKKLGRYSKMYPRMIMKFVNQEMPKELDTYVDT